MTTSELIALLTIVASMINIISIGYLSWKKNKPEIKKLEAEGDSEIVDAALGTVEGAKLTLEMVEKRLEQVNQELENEKIARKRDADYFRRRIRELDRELRDYRSWAAKLAKQVIETGKIPVPFMVSADSDPSLPAIQESDDNK